MNNPNIPIDRQDVADEPPLVNCDYCGLLTTEEGFRSIVVNDESIELCEGCAEHYLG